MGQMTLNLNLCQRWRSRRTSYRPAGEPIDPSRYGVDLISEDDARSFVVEHHYSGTYPAARDRVGLFRCEGAGRAKLVGVAVFSVPMQQRVIPRWLGVDPNAGVELGRFVLLDDVEANGETWFLARALRALRESKPEIVSVVSYADPMPRQGDAGPFLAGHVGTIYQAMNGVYMGRSSRRRLTLDRCGRVVSGRALTKLRKGERGASGVYDRLRSVGAPKRRAGESGAEYVTRALREGPFQHMVHPGNHVYGWALTKPARRGLAPSAGSYPKQGA